MAAHLSIRIWQMVAAVVAAAVTVGMSVTPVASADPTGGADGARWTATEDGPQQYPGVHIDWDVPITMSDGTVLKANVYRPMDAAGRIVQTPLPTIVNLTPYTKLASMLATSAVSIPVLYDALVTLMNRFDLFDLRGTPLSGLGEQIRALSGGVGRTFAADPNLVRSGYTQIVVDVRGTGFSQGVWQAFGEREQQDTVEVVQWASKQPWSNGRIGMSGISYSAINQLQAAEHHAPGLQAIFPIVPGSDLLRDTVAPGGGFDVGFVPAWAALINIGKWIPDLASIATGRFDWKWLADRVASPITFIDTMLQALTVTSVDNIPPNLKSYLDPNGYFRTGLTGHPERITTPTFVIGGWHDIFANSEPRIIQEIPLPTSSKKLIMGDWYHLDATSGLGTPGAPPRVDVLQRAWFDKWLKDIDNGIDRYSPVTMWQQGGNWTTADRFPRPGMTYTRHYLTADPSGTTGTVAHDGSLGSAPPTDRTTLTAAPGLSTICSRDGVQGTAGFFGLQIIDACYKDSRTAEVAALTFTGRPVAAPTLISGPVNVHLNTVLDATDGYWSATLNDVAPDGNSSVLTSGQLTASLRKVDDGRSQRSADGDYTAPFHVLTLEDRQPVVPGQPTTLDIALVPTDAVLQPGHRLRVDIYAANFPRGMMIPALLLESQLKPQHLVLDPQAPSWVNLPLNRPL
ncbi:CocE/NonD family hydrolase [Skermania sp. ID1734]|uniref:CocE/NonD family hydrolase n=1 Tax=Skermania sp. ID1734 TaxID=2597516 RepID=UPI001180427E|nr:CocE/NonD family hydrolase [Skermania sp. ID1734]TSE00271.1 CocE/NonD family hydrolase [Skermania sp. ID1734]